MTTKLKILSAALDLSAKKGYQNISRAEVANAAGVATGLVNYYFETMAELRKAIMRAAINQPHLQVVAQGLSTRDIIALNAPPDIKVSASQWLLT